MTTAHASTTGRGTRRGLARAGVVAVIAALLAGGAGAGCQNARRQSSAASPDRDVREAARLAQQAQDALVAKKYDRAIDLSRRALTLNEGMWGAWNNMGVALMMTKDYMAAAESFKRAADLLPGDPRPYENLGNVYREQGFDADAVRYYGESLRRDPTWLPSLRGGIVSAKYMKKSDEAILEWAKRGLMLERDPAWREIFQIERYRVERDLEDLKNAPKGS